MTFFGQICHALLRHPLMLLPLLFLLAVLFSLGVRKVEGTRRFFREHAFSALYFFSLAMIAFYLVCLVAYVSSRAFLDHICPNVASVSWMLQTGRPVHHALDSAERYSLLYGPALYISNGFFLRVLGPSIFTSKLPGVVFAPLSLAVVYWALLKCSRHRTAVIGCACVAMAYLFYRQYSFWPRGDSHILLLVSLGLIATSKKPIVASLVSGLAFGLCVNVKVHSFLYFAPVYALLFQRHRYRYAVFSLVVAMVVALAPFLVLEQFSLRNYVLWLLESTKHRVSFGGLCRTIEWGLFLLAPVFLVRIHLAHTNLQGLREFAEKNKPFIYSVWICAAMVLAPAAKAGAGRHHLMPFIPLLTYLFVLLAGRLREWPGGKGRRYHIVTGAYLALFAAAVLNACARGGDTIRILASRDGFARSVIRDIERIAESRPGSAIEMGYGEKKGYDLTFYRPVLVFLGNPCLVDAGALMDMKAGGLALPENTIAALASGRTDIWLIPKGNSPFEMPTNYTPPDQLFDDRFRRTFFETYEFRERSEHFDLWYGKGAE